MRRSRWPGAWICSACAHAACFLLVSLFGAPSVTAPQDEVIEVALADDSFAPGESGGGGGGSPGDSAIVAPEEERADEAEETANEPDEPAVTEKTQRAQAKEPQPSKRAVRQPAPAQNRQSAKTGGAGGAGTGSGSGTGSGTGRGSGSGSGAGSGSGTGTGSGSGSGSESGAVSRPGILAQVRPDYPERERRAGVSGTVVLRVQILENGRAGDASVSNSSGSDALDASALRAVRQWRFIPAKNANGAPIACYTQIPIEFRLR